jgi:hypothetical protein
MSKNRNLDVIEDNVGPDDTVAYEPWPSYLNILMLVSNIYAVCPLPFNLNWIGLF